MVQSLRDYEGVRIRPFSALADEARPIIVAPPLTRQQFTSRTLDPAHYVIKPKPPDGASVEEAKIRADRDRLKNALMHMEQALRQLDKAAGHADIGAYLDLAICRLRDALEAERPD